MIEPRDHPRDKHTCRASGGLRHSALCVIVWRPSHTTVVWATRSNLNSLQSNSSTALNQQTVSVRPGLADRPPWTYNTEGMESTKPSDVTKRRNRVTELSDGTTKQRNQYHQATELLSDGTELHTTRSLWSAASAKMAGQARLPVGKTSHFLAGLVGHDVVLLGVRSRLGNLWVGSLG